MKEITPTIIAFILILWIFTGLGTLLGYNLNPERVIEKKIVVKEECEPVEVIGEPSEELTELSIQLSGCNKKLTNCWYDYENNCGIDCPICPECEDNGAEMQEMRVEIDNLLKSRDECRMSEGALLDKLNKCEAILPKF
jgi:hypothetical protein